MYIITQTQIDNKNRGKYIRERIRSNTYFYFCLLWDWIPGLKLKIQNSNNKNTQKPLYLRSENRKSKFLYIKSKFLFFYRAGFWSLTVAGKRLTQMGVVTKEKDLCLGLSVLGFPAYSLADSNRVSKLSLCLCLTQMGVETKKKDLDLGFSVLGFRIVFSNWVCICV